MATLLDGANLGGQRATNAADPTSAQDLATRAYVLSHAGMNYRAAWASGAYALNDVVTYNGRLYVCTTAVAAGLTPSFVGVTNSTPFGSASTIALPSGSLVGDLVVLIVNKQNSSSDSAIVVPTGFSTTATWNNPGTNADTYAGVFSKILTSTDITAGTISIPAQTTVAQCRAELWGFRCCAMGVSYATTTSGFTTAVITPDVGTSYVFSIAGCGTNGGGAVLAQSSLTNLTSVNSSQTVIAGGYETYVSGNTTARTFTLSGTTVYQTTNFAGVFSIVSTVSTFPASSFTEIAAVHDSSGRLQAADPAAAGDVATQGYVLAHAGSSSRATATATTVSLAPNAADTSTTITLSNGYVLYSIATSRPARVELYETAAAMTADSGRQIGVDPASSAGVVLDYVTAAATTVYSLSPLVTGANLETVPSSTISMRVTNNDVSTGTITVTLVWLKVE